MILKTSTLALVLCVTWVNYVNGAPYSNVYVQSGPEVLPVEYYQYGSPSYPIAGGQYAQLSAAPAGSNLVPVSTVPVSSVANYVSPCGSSCFYPGQNVAPISQFAPASANLVAYNSPISSVPVVPREETGYQYSYVVYDEHTGDHKAQREHSDGSVVRGEYSLIQPDGYVREVQYVADDLNGFNAVVKNYLPATVEEVKIVEHVEKKIPVPCIEVKPFIEVQDIIEHDIHDPVKELISDSHQSEHAHNEGEHHKHSEEAHNEQPHQTEESHHVASDITQTHHSHSSEEHPDLSKESHPSLEDASNGHPEEAHSGHKEESHHNHLEETQHEHPEGTHNIEVVEIVNCAHEVNHNHPEESQNAHLEESHDDTESSDEENEAKESKEDHHGQSEHHQEHDEGTHHTDHYESEAEAHHSSSEHHNEVEHHGHSEDQREMEGAHGHSKGHENIKYIHHSHAKEDPHSESQHQPEERAHHGQTEVILFEKTSHPEQSETAHHTKHGESNTQVSYDEVIRCAQTAVDEANEASNSHKVDKSSPSYIILNKPC